MMNAATSEYLVMKYQDEAISESKDILTAEHPLEIRLENAETGDQYPLAVTMRTPGHDLDLAAGFLVSERIIQLTDAVDVRPLENGSVAAVRVPTNIYGRYAHEPTLERHFLTGSSCGLCGKIGLEDLSRLGYSKVPPWTMSNPGILLMLAGAMRKEQSVFEKTGSLHAAGLFRSDGALILLREDVGRHNAVDKVVGDRFRHGALPLIDHILMISGRVSYEIVQKAISAGIGIVAAVSGPSDLAVQLANSFGVCVVGFLRDGRFNVYTHSERIWSSPGSSVRPIH